MAARPRARSCSFCAAARRTSTRWDMKPERAARISRAVPADRHHCPRHRALRALAAVGPAGASPGAGAFDRRPRSTRTIITPGYYYNLTGHVADPTFLSLGNNRTPYADDWPFMGTVVAAKRPPHPTLANAITLPHKPSKAPYTRPGQFAARLGVEHDPLYLEGSLEGAAEVLGACARIAARHDGRASQLAARHCSRRLTMPDASSMRNERTVAWTRQQQRAFDLLSSSATAGRSMSPASRKRSASATVRTSTA